jgi:RNA polymerase sigma-70 factor (ECF subfamily)
MASLGQALEPGIALPHSRWLWETSRVTETAETDAQLKAARRGDGDAFVDLFMAHERRLRLLAFGVLRDPNLVDDALQETALRAFRSLGRFRGEARMGTWLHRIALRVCLDMIADTQRQVALAQRAQPTEPAAADPDAALDDQTRLARALAQLSPQQRSVVVVVLQLGFDLQSAATILAIPRGTVASRLYAARQALMTALHPQEEPHA